MHLWIQPALLVYEIMFVLGSKLLTTTHFKLGIKKRKTCIINIFPPFLISSFLHCEMSVVWQIWGRKNSLESFWWLCSNNKYVSHCCKERSQKRMENREGWLSPKTQPAGPLPLCLRENNQSQACPHLSPFKHAGCILFRERLRLCVETTSGLVSTTMKIALGQNPGLLSRWSWHELLYFLQESTL